MKAAGCPCCMLGFIMIHVVVSESVGGFGYERILSCKTLCLKSLFFVIKIEVPVEAILKLRRK